MTPNPFIAPPTLSAKAFSNSCLARAKFFRALALQFHPAQTGPAVASQVREGARAHRATITDRRADEVIE
jgi:hypothetical protein